MLKRIRTSVALRQLKGERYQGIGYVLAGFLQGLLITVMYLVLHQLPSFRFVGLLSLLLVALVALFWGTGPSLLSTAVGTLLLGLLLLPSILSWSIDPADALGTVLFLCVGCIISMVAGQTLRARRIAEQLAEQLALERQHLNAIIDTLPDAVTIHDRDGKLLRSNAALGKLFGIEASSRESIPAQLSRMTRVEVYSEDGKLLSRAEWPMTRILECELPANGAIEDVRLHRADGRDVWINTRGAVIYNAEGQRVGVVCVNRDVTERRQLERNAREALQAANQHMSDFLSLVSHELRTPLTSIKSNVWLSRNLLSDYKAPPAAQGEGTSTLLEEVQDSLARVDAQVDVQKRLVDDLLDVSRMQANQLELHLFPHNLASIVRQVVEELQPIDTAHRLSTVSPYPASVMVLVDADRIRQVLNNYIMNAFKHALPECPIEVRLQVNEQQVVVSVQDGGPGLSAEEREHVWDRFYQVKKETGRTRLNGELGLGLYICKTIIERHQGQVGVESAPGQGSRFWFSLPREDMLVESIE